MKPTLTPASETWCLCVKVYTTLHLASAHDPEISTAWKSVKDVLTNPNNNRSPWLVLQHTRGWKSSCVQGESYPTLVTPCFWRVSNATKTSCCVGTGGNPQCTRVVGGHLRSRGPASSGSKVPQLDEDDGKEEPHLKDDAWSGGQTRVHTYRHTHTRRDTHAQRHVCAENPRYTLSRCWVGRQMGESCYHTHAPAVMLSHWGWVAYTPCSQASETMMSPAHNTPTPLSQPAPEQIQKARGELESSLHSWCHRAAQGQQLARLRGQEAEREKGSSLSNINPRFALFIYLFIFFARWNRSRGFFST